jgi:hypothetical protein
MRPTTAVLLATGVSLSACAPYPVPVGPAPTPLVAASSLSAKCLMIRDQIARQQRIAALSGVMSSALVEASVRLNTYNVISGLEQLAAIEGCPVVYGWNGRRNGPESRYTV